MSMIKTLELNWQLTFSFLWKLLYCSIDFNDILIQMATSLRILLNFKFTTWPWYLLTTFGGSINTWDVNTIDNFKID
jgi:hypothetical protein